MSKYTSSNPSSNHCASQHPASLRSTTRARGAPVGPPAGLAWIAVLLLVAALAAPFTAHAIEPILFPARGSEQADDTYWTLINLHAGLAALDVDVRQLRDGFWWSYSGENPIPNNKRYAWDRPLYAPASGEIISCWRNTPDNPDTDTPDVGRCCGNDCSKACDESCSEPCLTSKSGNHVVILKPDGDAITLSHFKSGTVPPELCPNDDVYMNDAKDRTGPFPIESYLRLCGPGETPQADGCFTSRPRVVQGQLVGHTGSSGASGAPHFHIGTDTIDETGAEPAKTASPETVYAYAWARDLPPGSAWQPMVGDPIITPPKSLVHASPFLRRGGEAAGDVKETATLFLDTNYAVTATVGDPGDEVKLITWQVSGSDHITRKGDLSTGVFAKAVYLSEPASDHVLAAYHLVSDELEMRAYRISAGGGTITEVGVWTAGPIDDLAVATTSGVQKRTVTAVRTQQTSSLKLIAWDVAITPEGTSIERLGDIGGSTITDVAVSRSRVFDGVFTAVRDGGGTLVVTPWRLSPDGMVFSPGLNDGGDTVGSELALVPLASGVAVAVQNADDELRVMTWTATPGGDLGARQDSWRGGEVLEVEMVTSPHGDSNFATIVRSGDGRLLVIGWKVDADGDHLARLGSSRAGAASFLSADMSWYSIPGGGDPQDRLMTTMRATGGELRVITWDTNLVNP